MRFSIKDFFIFCAVLIGIAISFKNDLKNTNNDQALPKKYKKNMIIIELSP